jgi:hypothetical protein
MALSAGAAQAIAGGTPTTAFEAVGIFGVQLTSDWVLTAQHAAFNPGDTYGNGYGARIVAQRYDAPGSGLFPANDLALLRLEPLAPDAAALPLIAVSDTAIAEGTFAAIDVTITSGLNSGPARGYGYTTITESTLLAQDGSGPIVTVNWLLSWDGALYVQGGDSGGGLFLGHVTGSSVLLGITSALLTDEHDNPLGSAFVQPAAYRSWIDSVMAGDLTDSQTVLWVGAPVPEPTPTLLLAGGLLALAWRRHRGM